MEKDAADFENLYLTKTSKSSLIYNSKSHTNQDSRIYYWSTIFCLMITLRLTYHKIRKYEYPKDSVWPNTQIVCLMIFFKKNK